MHPAARSSDHRSIKGVGSTVWVRVFVGVGGEESMVHVCTARSRLGVNESVVTRGKFCLGTRLSPTSSQRNSPDLTRERLARLAQER